MTGVVALAAVLTGEVDPGRRLVLVLVGSFDRRATELLVQAWRIPARERSWVWRQWQG